MSAFQFKMYSTSRDGLNENNPSVKKDTVMNVTPTKLESAPKFPFDVSHNKRLHFFVKTYSIIPITKHVYSNIHSSIKKKTKCDRNYLPSV